MIYEYEYKIMIIVDYQDSSDGSKVQYFLTSEKTCEHWQEILCFCVLLWNILRANKRPPQQSQRCRRFSYTFLPSFPAWCLWSLLPVERWDMIFADLDLKQATSLWVVWSFTVILCSITSLNCFLLLLYLVHILLYCFIIWCSQNIKLSGPYFKVTVDQITNDDYFSTQSIELTLRLQGFDKHISSGVILCIQSWHPLNWHYKMSWEVEECDQKYICFFCLNLFPTQINWICWIFKPWQFHCLEMIRVNTRNYTKHIHMCAKNDGK